MISFPHAVIGTAIAGLKGAVVGLFFAGVMLLVITLCSERVVAKICRAEKRISPGMERTIESLMVRYQGVPPRVLVYPESFPNVLVAKSLGSQGSVFLSQGLIALLNDLELQAILGMCIEEIKRPGIVLQSLSSTLALLVLLFWPEAWCSLVFPGRLRWKGTQRNLTPFLTVPMVVLLPVARIFCKLGQLPVRSQAKAEGDENRNTAVGKIIQTSRIWGLSERRESLGFFSLNLGQ